MKQLIVSHGLAGDHSKKPGDEFSDITWHPAFIEAIQLELEEYKDFLEFKSEYRLSKEPLRIDCIVIKKAQDVIIRKNIAKIFRDVNLLEYKSPGDYVSVNDFYKIYGYACLYCSFEGVPVTGITVSFVGSRYPKKLITHLRETKGYVVEESGFGIYTVKGDTLPIQIIDTRRLSADENLWLKDLNNGLDGHQMRRIITEIARQVRPLILERIWMR